MEQKILPSLEDQQNVVRRAKDIFAEVNEILEKCAALGVSVDVQQNDVSDYGFTSRRLLLTTTFKIEL